MSVRLSRVSDIHYTMCLSTTGHTKQANKTPSTTVSLSEHALVVQASTVSGVGTQTAAKTTLQADLFSLRELEYLMERGTRTQCDLSSSPRALRRQLLHKNLPGSTVHFDSRVTEPQRLHRCTSSSSARRFSPWPLPCMMCAVQELRCLCTRFGKPTADITWPLCKADT